MCGRFALSLNASQLANTAREEVDQDVGPMEEDEASQWQGDRYNVAPQTRIPVLRRNASGLPALTLMLWGLPPTAETRLKTINARDDTILAGGGMWQSIRGRKRAIVFCDGFYEWLKKGSERIPHFTARSDGHPLAMAAMWDSVTYEGESESIQSVTIVTTDSNKQLSFLHDRMPVILPDAQAMLTWLDTSSREWSSEVSRLMKPFEGKLKCYPVAKEVGKVGNNSKDFIVPVSERKGNLHSFFAKAQAKADASPKKLDQAPSVNSESNAPLDIESGSPSRKRARTSEDEKPEKKPKPDADGGDSSHATTSEAIDVDAADLTDAKIELAKTGKIDGFVKKSP